MGAFGDEDPRRDVCGVGDPGAADCIAAFVEQLRASGPIRELVARRLVCNLDRVETFRMFDQRRGLPCDPKSFASRHEQMLRMRHRFAIEGLPRAVDRSLVWQAIEQGLHEPLADVTLPPENVALAE